jgi:hypothetical protein
MSKERKYIIKMEKQRQKVERKGGGEETNR